MTTTADVFGSELLDRVDGFYDLPEAERQELLELIRTIAKQEPEAFKEAVQSENLHGPNYLDLMYEALAYELPYWGDFLRHEFSRILEAAKLSDTPDLVLKNLDFFCIIDPGDFKHRTELVMMLVNELEHPKPVFRYYALYLLPDHMNDQDWHAVEKIRACLNDSDWRVRSCAYSALESLEKLERHEKLSLMDRLKGHVLDEGKFN